MPWRSWREQPTARLDLATVALLIAADEYPDLDVTVYLAHLDDLADDIRPQLTGNWDTDLAIFTGTMFDSDGFTGNGSDYYDPRNSYLNDVLDRKLGIPITLAIPGDRGRRAARIPGARRGLAGALCRTSPSPNARRANVVRPLPSGPNS